MRGKQLLIVLIAVCLPAVAANAEEGASILDRPGLEVGARYWYSIGRNGYNYYADKTTSLLVSALNYDNLQANSGEVYFRGDLKWGLFVKGFAGAGTISGGTLIDEDFPPAVVPYSRTTSDASGSLNYGTIDVGYSPVRYPAGRLGFFAGYGRWHESINAAGCTQVGGNPDICAPPLAPSIAVVSEADTWNLLRLGATADAMLGEHFKLTADAAYVRAFQNAVDNHFFTLGPDPASGNGNGFQLEAILAYQLSDAFNLGIGGRWWHLDTNAVDSFDQLLTYRTDRYGVFVQGGYRFN